MQWGELAQAFGGIWKGGDRPSSVPMASSASGQRRAVSSSHSAAMSPIVQVSSYIMTSPLYCPPLWVLPLLRGGARQTRSTASVLMPQGTGRLPPVNRVRWLDSGAEWAQC